ncbi:ferritin family protein [Leptospira interrogans]|uniref:Rubrerythrin diiron-binding domain-containing protein n=11 Tax=Leptospira interrogans TaxID=173 RepID=Q8EXE5_LEPIN|nr:MULTISPECIES: ferritin family protein [Leptospira]APH43376.1 Rubrerythrin [Leptospira interrogans serovar Copenhageni/Icterohaemorrhagiae]EMF74147.1 rubrerythrin [Leptospira interrogans serovar Canicola str. LT1962]EMN28805.1 rubrerythrin [Leptospira interrogans serovar Pyrogenes str. L0374]EMO03819.1 rubrerythrin [Leptospira interrogans serovar Icterohaemorrhagiae str. Verdun HP]EMP08008.1 rubrerythrin [Leptospira interrogans serovar Pyrogenes str. 200701872]EMY02499.1 rubrerythrin [Lepto
MNIKPLKETTFLEAVAAAIQHEKDYFEFYMSTYEKLPPGDTKELFERLAEEVDDHIKFITELYEQAEGSELPNLKQLAAIHKFHDSTLQKLMNKVERTISGPGTKDAHEALELAIREAENAVSFYEKLANKFEDVNIKSLFTKLKDYNQNYQSLLETELNGLDQSQSGSGQGTFFWDEQAEEVVKAESKPVKTTSPSKKPSSATTSTPKTTSVTTTKAAAPKQSATTVTAKKVAPKKTASKSVAKKTTSKKKVAVKKAVAKSKKPLKKKVVKKTAPKKKTSPKKSKKKR